MRHQDPQTASPRLNSFLLSPLPQNYTCAFPCCHMSKGPPAAFPSNRCGVNPWGTLAALSQCLHGFKIKSPKWKHQRDNPPMSQIFTGTEPLVGASEGNWRQRRPRFNQRKEFGDGGMRGFAAVRCPPWIQNITKKYFKQRAAFCPVNTGIYSSLTALALQSASSTIKTQAQFTVTSF